MKKIILLYACLSALLGIGAKAQNRTSFVFRDVLTGEYNRFEAGDKVILVYELAYYKEHFREMQVRVARAQGFSQAFTIYRQGRILYATDTSLVLTDGSFAPFRALQRIKKLTLGKQFLRMWGIRTDGIPVRGLEVHTPATSSRPQKDTAIQFPPIRPANIHKIVLPAQVRAGDKVLLAYDYDYYARNRDKINVRVINPRKPKYGKILYGKERILRITDTSFIFTNGTHAHFNSLLAVRKLSFGKRILRTIGMLAGSFIVYAATIMGVLGIIYAVFSPEGIIIALASFAAFLGGVFLIQNNNNKIHKKYLIPKK